jgi:hypothetical protein
MSINRWLVLAGLLAIGACGPNPSALCVVDDQNVNLDTEEQLCTPSLGTPVTSAALPSDDEDPDASVQR